MYSSVKETQKLLAFAPDLFLTRGDREERKRATPCVALAQFVRKVGAERERVIRVLS